MKNLLLILIFGTFCMCGYSQTRNEPEPIISMYHEKIVVKLYRTMASDSTYHHGSIYVFSLNNDKLSIPVFDAYCYYDIYNPDYAPDSLFQHLYNWLEEIERYVAKYEYKEVIWAEFRCAGPDLIIDFPLIYIKNINCDCHDYATWDSGMIAKLKKRIIEYTESNNINIKL
jgi:hypothetical protein